MNNWQTSSSKKTSKRAFVGNLNNHTNIEEKLRHLFSKSALSVQGIEIVPLKQPNTKCYALVKCNVGMAIKCLNGMKFEGNVLNVKTEKNQKQLKKRGMGFGGGWAAPTKNPMQQNISAPNQNKLQEPGANPSILDHEDIALTTKDQSDDISSFHARCSKDSLKELMSQYGTYDPDYEKMKSLNINDDASRPSPQQSELSLSQNNIQHSGTLAPNGKAPIHIELVSFGFKYSVPSQARDGWSHSNPMSPIDCRDLPRCPHFVSKLSGLSFKVKRAMLSTTIEESQSDDESCEVETSVKGVNPLLKKSEEVSEVILRAVEEAINDGGHGYAFPLEVKIHLGSEYGRHRSVVLCENLAQKIRSLLRANKGGRITQPISVSTRHRDVDQKHKDEEAFGKDLRREHDAEVKRKRRQERLESHW